MLLKSATMRKINKHMLNMATNRTQKEKWEQFNKDMKNKRLKICKGGKPNKTTKEELMVGANILKTGEMIVQQLESEPTGKAKRSI